MRLRARGVNDKNVLRAFEAVPRDFFAAPAHRDLARRDVALPLGCGQIVGAPSDLALALAALDLAQGASRARYRDGFGLCGRRHRASRGRGDLGRTLPHARHRSQASARRLRPRQCRRSCKAMRSRKCRGRGNSSAPSSISRSPSRPAAVARRLAEGAICVFARPAAPMCHLVRAERLAGGGWREELVGLTRVGPPIAGVSRYL